MDETGRIDRRIEYLVWEINKIRSVNVTYSSLISVNQFEIDRREKVIEILKEEREQLGV